MKILWISQQFPPSMGGVQQYVYNTVLHMKSSSIVLCSGRQDEACKHIDENLVNLGHKVIRSCLIPGNTGVFCLFKNPISIIKFSYYVQKLVKKEKVGNIIFGQISFFFLYTITILKYLFRMPSISICFHGEDIPVIKMKSNFLMRWGIKIADYYMCNSSFTCDRLNKFLSEDKKRYIAYPGVEEKFFNIADRDTARSKYNVDKNRVLYSIGRLDKRKGHDLVLKALSELIKKFPDIVYLIAGKGPNLHSLKDDVENMGIQNFVKFLGFVPEDEVMALHAAGDIFVMPNRILEDGDTEGFGIVFIEASASGKPVIAGRAGGAIEAVEDGVTGYLVNPYDTKELIEKIEYLFLHPDEAEAMANLGKRRAWEKFRWPVLVEKFEDKVIEQFKY